MPDATSAASESRRAAHLDALLKKCVKCGLCLPTCPTYQLTYDERSSPRGRLELMRAVNEGELPANDATYRGQMAECLGCRNCEPVCPSGVRYGEALDIARESIAQDDATHLRGALVRLAYDAVLGSPVGWRCAGAAARFYQRSGARAALRRSGLFDAFGVAGLEALVPDLADEPFPVDGSTWLPAGKARRGKAALFAGCVMSEAFARVHRATIRLLTSAGWEVEVTRGQGCCGALHAHAGFRRGAAALARRNVRAFAASGADVIVVNAAGCGALLKEYGALLSGAACASAARVMAAKVRDFSEAIDADSVADAGGRVEARAAYQDPCHLAHAQGVRTQPRALLDAVPGLVRVEMTEADRCCGSAGTYNVTHPAFANALRARKIAAAVDAGADRLVTANPGCQLHLAPAAAAAGLKLQHLAELLDEALPQHVMHATRHRRSSADRLQGLRMVAAGFATAWIIATLLRRI